MCVLRSVFSRDQYGMVDRLYKRRQLLREPCSSTAHTVFFFFKCPAAPRDLPSSPTRPSSDLLPLEDRPPHHHPQLSPQLSHPLDGRPGKRLGETEALVFWRLEEGGRFKNPLRAKNWGEP